MSRKRPQNAADELAGPPPKRERCAAKTAKGARCKRIAAEGTDRCPVHLGAPVGGRPSKLTAEVAEEVLKVIRVGGYVETAAAAAGISKQTFYSWLDRGDPDGKKKTDEPFRQFRIQVDQALAEGEARNVEIIAAAGFKDWKASAWLLERQHAARWAGPRGRGINSSIHPDDFAAGETSGGQQVLDDQVGPDGSPL